jgi:hypothetical protein
MIPVSADLDSPELGPGRRHFAQRATMPVPETAMHKDDNAVCRKHYIRPSRQVLTMQPEAEASGVQSPPQNELWLRVLAPDAAHIEPPLLRREDVRQKINHSAAANASDIPADGIESGMARFRALAIS